MNKKAFFRTALLVISLILTLSMFTGCMSMLDASGGKSDEPEHITNAYINTSGELIVCYSDGSRDNLGLVVGKDGKDGVDGKDGKDGVDGKDGQDAVIPETPDTDSDSSGGSNAGSSTNTTIVVEETDYAKSIATCIQSTVIIQCAFKTSYYSTDYDAASAGSGIIYSCDKASGDAIIVTNYHVVYGEDSITSNGISDKISVFLYGSVSENTAIEATYIGGSMTYDLAVLKISNSDILKNSQAKAVTIKDSSKIHVGDRAFAIGNPQGLGFSVTSGIISVDSENVEIPAADGSGDIVMRLLRMDTPVNSGNSGGGLFDGEGKLIGIVNAKNVEDTVENVGYSIPSSTMVAIVENILYHCENTSLECVRRALLGITVTITNPYSVYNPETGYVDLYESSVVYEVSTTGIAYGKLQAGDIIKNVAISGSTELSTEITRQYQLLDALLYARVNDTVTLTIERDNNLLDIDLIITNSCISNS